MIGEPDAGNPHVRFDEGRQETCVRAARLSPTPPESPSSAMLLSLHWSARSSPLRSCQVDRRRRPVIETLVQALVVVELEVAGLAPPAPTRNPLGTPPRISANATGAPRKCC